MVKIPLKVKLFSPYNWYGQKQRLKHLSYGVLVKLETRFMVQKLHTNTELSFMSGGGNMGAYIRAYDWSATSLGSPETWPQPLKLSLRLMLSTGHPMLIWWGKDLIQFYNDAYSLSLGSERHPSSIGQQGHICWAEIWPQIEPQISLVLEGRGHTWNENQLLSITRNGIREDMYWTYSYGPIDDPQAETGVGGVLVVCTETTKQVHAEQNMKEAEARWRALFDQTPSFMCILHGPEHHFEYANRNYLEIVGKEDVLGKTVLEVLPEVAAQGFMTLLDEVYQSGKSYQGVAVPLNIDSAEPIYIDFIYQPIFAEDGQVTGIFVEGYNATDRILANDVLKEADRRKDEFLAMLAHELRNPLAPIRNVCEILTQSAEQDSKLQNIGDILNRQVSQMTHLLDDLLDISRISQDRIVLQREALNVTNLINLTLESLQSTIAAKNHTIQFTNCQSALFVDGDNTRLVQCLTNIVNNAIKYTPTGGEIKITLSASANEVYITVSDNGCGISKDMQTKVFELFAQAKQTLDRSQGGLGIGLNIVQRLVQMHGGKVSVSSEGVDCGSSFKISLPRVDTPVNNAKASDNAKKVSKRVLVVDDNKDSADTMAELLIFRGHEVIVSYSAQQALEKVDSFDPQIVLLDIGLPEMDGYEVAQTILSKGKKRLLVAITGYGQAEDIRKAKEVGFDFHFTKPVNISELTKVF